MSKRPKVNAVTQYRTAMLIFIEPKKGLAMEACLLRR